MGPSAAPIHGRRYSDQTRDLWGYAARSLAPQSTSGAISPEMHSHILPLLTLPAKESAVVRASLSTSTPRVWRKAFYTRRSNPSAAAVPDSACSESRPDWASILHARPISTLMTNPMTWHAHEMGLGYSMAVIAGFLLTAVRNWHGRETCTGWPLTGLAALWLTTRFVWLQLGLLPGPPRQQSCRAAPDHRPHYRHVQSGPYVLQQGNF